MCLIRVKSLFSLLLVVPLQWPHTCLGPLPTQLSSLLPYVPPSFYFGTSVLCFYCTFSVHLVFGLSSFLVSLSCFTHHPFLLFLKLLRCSPSVLPLLPIQARFHLSNFSLQCRFKFPIFPCPLFILRRCSLSSLPSSFDLNKMTLLVYILFLYFSSWPYLSFFSLKHKVSLGFPSSVLMRVAILKKDGYIVCYW